MQSVKTILILFLLIGGCIALVGCESDDKKNIVSQEEFNSLQKGMTYEEVIGILGEPYTSNTMGDYTGGTWFYENDTTLCTVMFRNNRLYRKDVGAPEPPEIEVPDVNINIPEINLPNV